MHYVYLITNKVNGKVYVGQTELSVEERFKEHVWTREKKDHFHFAIKKYGKDAFFAQEIGRYETPEESSNAERLWILLMKSYDRKIGYNTTFGGEYGGRPTEETKAKIGLASSRRSHGPSTRKKMREAHIGVAAPRQKKTTDRVGVGLFGGRYRSRTKVHGKDVCFGFFDTLEEAVQAREDGLSRIDEIGLDAFLVELKETRKSVTAERLKKRRHRPPLSQWEKEQASLRAKQRWAKNFNITHMPVTQVQEAA